MTNFPASEMLHYGTGLRICTIPGFIDKRLREMSFCGWLRYSSAFSSAVITMTEMVILHIC
ncbi:MAG TPA: hypothetical protein DDW43_03825 [Nitrosomonas sp.]|nr:hypothetical protein [Nitrosomonas sp.]